MSSRASAARARAAASLQVLGGRARRSASPSRSGDGAGGYDDLLDPVLATIFSDAPQQMLLGRDGDAFGGPRAGPRREARRRDRRSRPLRARRSRSAAGSAPAYPSSTRPSRRCPRQPTALGSIRRAGVGDQLEHRGRVGRLVCAGTDRAACGLPTRGSRRSRPAPAPQHRFDPSSVDSPYTSPS